MKKKRSFIIIVSASITVLFIALYFFQKEGVEVDEVSIDWKKNPCDVNFFLINKQNYYVSCKVSIRGFRVTPGRHTPAYVEPGFSGEKILDIELYPKERRKVKETLYLSGDTARIKVHAFNVQILQ